MKTVSKKNRTETTTITTTPANVSLITPPPADARIPTPPEGFEIPPNARYGTVQPKKIEMVAMPNAVVELGKFTDYAETLGKTVPPQPLVRQMFAVASQWSTMRIKAAAWDAYCNTQEALAWQGVRAQLKRIKPAFALAVQSDDALGAKYPALASLLMAKSTIAIKAVSTRRLNKLAIAEGKPPIHGGVGKRRKRAADKAAGAAKASEHAALPAPNAASSAPPPQQQPSQPQAAAVTSAPTALNGAALNGAAVNGAAHS